MQSATTAEIWEWLEGVKDPEIPLVSIVDMGMVLDVEQDASGRVRIQIMPTFVGCPALEMIRQSIKQCLASKGVKELEVEFSLSVPWSSMRITEQGRENLIKHGIAPPPQEFKPGDSWTVSCPFCASPKTVIDNLFGPTACRSILYCTSCKNPFEAIKPI